MHCSVHIPWLRSGHSLDGGRYVGLSSLDLICDNPDHYKEWIEGVSCPYIGTQENIPSSVAGSTDFRPTPVSVEHSLSIH